MGESTKIIGVDELQSAMDWLALKDTYLFPAWMLVSLGVTMAMIMMAHSFGIFVNSTTPGAILDIVVSIIGLGICGMGI